MSNGGRPDNPDAEHRLARPTARADADRAAATDGKASSRPARRVALTLRTRWWPRFLAAGVLLLVIGGTLLSGIAQALVAGAGAAIILVLMVKSGSSSNDSKYEQPSPPGAPPPQGGISG